MTTNERGSVLLLTAFAMLSISILVVSYWLLIQVSTRTFFLREKNIQAYYAARGGIEDAVSEIKAGNPWLIGSVSSQWTLVNGNTFSKATSAADPLTHFDYAATIYVTLTGDPSSGTVNILSRSEISSFEEPAKLYSKSLEAQVIRTLAGEIVVLGIREL